MLSPEELEQAKAAEALPWPLPEPKRVSVGKSCSAPAVRMPVVLDLTDSGIPMERLSLAQLEVRSRTREGLLVESTGSDPQIHLPRFEVPAWQVDRIIVEGRVVSEEAGPVPVVLELFWKTAHIPDFHPLASARLPWPRGKDAVLPVRDIPFWRTAGTPLLQLRVDPCERAGVRVLIRRVILAPKPGPTDG